MGLHLAALFFPILVSTLFVFSSEFQQIGSNQLLVNDLDAAKLRISQLGEVSLFLLKMVFGFKPQIISL